MIGATLKERYKIYEKIGKGGFGDVYLAENTASREKCAVKVLNPHTFISDEIRRMFIKDLKILLTLSHPNIVRVIDIGIESDMCFMVSEYIEGEDLSTRLERYQEHGRNFSVEEVLEVARDICPAIDYAHEQRVLHLDIEPGNIMRMKKGSYKIKDFRIESLVLRYLSNGMRDPFYSIFGRLFYSSPEIVKGHGIDRRADVYSLSATFYHLLAGHPPLYDEGEYQLMIKILKERPEALVGFPESINSAILWGLEKNPDNRPKSASELLKAMVKKTI